MTDHPRKRLEELFEGYVEDRLSPRELEEFERLAPLEPGLAERARQEAELVRALREEGRAAKAPVDLMAGVRRAMEAESTPLRPVRIRRTWMPLAAAAALAAMVAGGGALMLSQRGGEPGRYDIAMDMRPAEEPARPWRLAKDAHVHRSSSYHRSRSRWVGCAFGAGVDGRRVAAANEAAGTGWWLSTGDQHDAGRIGGGVDEFHPWG